MTIFFVHRGNPFYLKYAIAQVVSVMPNDRAILLGDETNQNILKNKIEWYPIKSYWETAKSFETVYVHLSPNSKDFELFCYQRWMVVYDWINSHQLEGQMACLDSDVLVFENLSTILDAKKLTWQRRKKSGQHLLCFAIKRYLANLLAIFLRVIPIRKVLVSLRIFFTTEIHLFS
jgi:hypothetical protein